MAAPMVVGTASLMLSVNPKLTAAELKKIICSTADTIETSSGPVPVLDPERAVQGAKNFDAVMAVRSETSMPSGFALHQNYPNPFNPTTIISFDLPKSGAVSLNVYNALGELVQTLVGGQLSAGKHGVSFDGSRLSSGVYFYRLQAGGSVFIKKMLLLK
jgi:subtilisin family serine protease